jgi:hypothetical protein
MTIITIIKICFGNTLSLIEKINGLNKPNTKENYIPIQKRYADDANHNDQNVENHHKHNRNYIHVKDAKNLIECEEDTGKCKQISEFKIKKDFVNKCYENELSVEIPTNQKDPKSMSYTSFLTKDDGIEKSKIIKKQTFSDVCYKFKRQVLRIFWSNF